ncbi:MBL fold metallo-hydrolase [Fredinandcohnia sp. QZ13]|uniref:MBL fold metallo-hydrolase n=1 Tax=Fredinandcohnia sp. QZ13 TaxID=3073144 RepID=UPI0028534278|nr:MBL fold metallo-hydrolase [Fredinandcohnia sp. QZ13]MDR4887498.1 MBL fold metallo-hydrolase [Fredinandcohnia sp. QZ13]
MDLMNEILEFDVQSSEISIWYLAGAGFVCKTQNSLFMMDPYLNTLPDTADLTRKPFIPFDADKIRKLDLIFSSHEHDDHCDQKTIEAVAKNTKAIFIGPMSSTNKASSWGFSDDRLRSVKAGDVFNIDHIKITTLECFDPACPDGNIYLIETEGITMIYCGDSFGHEKFKQYGEEYDIDIAFVSTAINPPGVNWYMPAGEACEAVKMLHPKLFIPMHWNIWQEAYLSPLEIHRAAVEKNIADITLLMGVGERITYKKG